MERKKHTKIYYFVILLYGSILTAILLGHGNLYGSMTDWLGQHTVIPEIFRQAFYESGQLIPNFLFPVGGGQNAFHFTYYGFLSPVILLSYVLPFVDMTTYVMGASFVLYLLTGILVFVFLKHHFGEHKALASAIIFLTLPPVNYHFHHHVMFVWYLPFLMLALIGLDRNLENQHLNGKKGNWKKSILFVIAAFCMILTNYYFSVGSLVCLFVYALYHILKEENCTLKYFWKQFWQTVYLFFLPVLLSAFVLLPTAYGLFGNTRSYGENEQTVMENVVAEDALSLDTLECIWQEIQELFLPNLPETFLGNFSIGITGLMLVAVIGNLAYKGRKKSDLFLNGILLVVAACPLISYVLNGMLYARGKVLIPFAILFVFALNQFVGRLEQKVIHWKYLVMITGVFLILCGVARSENYQICVCILLGMGATVLFQKKPEILYFCTIAVLFTASIRENKEETYVPVEAYEKLYSDEIETLMAYTEEGWFRTNVAYKENLTGNKVYGNKFYGNSVYSSTFNRLYQDFYKKHMGNNQRYRNTFLTSGARNELFYSFMGTRYIIGACDPGLSYEKVAEGEHLNLYENVLAYPMIYKSQKTMCEAAFDAMQFPYATEALMTHTILEYGESTEYVSQLEEIEVAQNYQFVQQKKETYEIVLDESYRGKLLYLTFDIVNEGEFRNKKDISISINEVKNRLTKDTWLYYNGNTQFDYVISLEDTNTLTIEISEGLFDIQNLGMYTSPMISETYEAVRDLEKNEFWNEISCTVDAKQGEYLVTSIPFDKGFSAFVNGKKVDVEVVNKAFVGLKLEAGENEIVIKYKAPLFDVGCMVTLFGLLLVVCDWFDVKSRIKIWWQDASRARR